MFNDFSDLIIKYAGIYNCQLPGPYSYCQVAILIVINIAGLICRGIARNFKKRFPIIE